MDLQSHFRLSLEYTVVELSFKNHQIILLFQLNVLYKNRMWRIKVIKPTSIFLSHLNAGRIRTRGVQNWKELGGGGSETRAREEGWQKINKGRYKNEVTRQKTQTEPVQLGILQGLMTYQQHSTEQFLTRAYDIMHGWERGNNFLDVFLHNSVNNISDKL